MYNGNFKGASEFYLKWHRSGGKRFSTASYYMLDCGSGITKKRLKAFRQDPSSDFIPHRNWSYSSGCPVWKSDLGDEFRQNFYTKIPTVIIQGSWDLYTPYENAVELLPYFKNSKFVTVQDGPHWAVGSAMEHSSEFNTGIREFVTSGKFENIPELVELPNVSWVIPNDVSVNDTGDRKSKP